MPFSGQYSGFSDLRIFIGGKIKSSVEYMQSYSRQGGEQDFPVWISSYYCQPSIYPYL